MPHRRQSKKSSSDSGGGLMSSAGIMRYYDADESRIRLQPRTVVILCITLAVSVLIFTHLF